MGLPRKKKKVVPDIGAAVLKAAGREPGKRQRQSPKKKKSINKGGRPSPRSGNVARMTLLLNEDTSERLTMALAAEQVKRRKEGEKVDKSFLIEEAILDWLRKNGF